MATVYLKPPDIKSILFESVEVYPSSPGAIPGNLTPPLQTSPREEILQDRLLLPDILRKMEGRRGGRGWEGDKKRTPPPHPPPPPPFRVIKYQEAFEPLDASQLFAVTTLPDKQRDSLIHKDVFT